MSRPQAEICYVVNDLEASIHKWIKMTGAGPFYAIDGNMMTDRVYRGGPAEDTFQAALGFMGTTILEFIQPTNDKPSILREILDTKGETVHHILPSVRALTPSQYDAEYARYVDAGLEPAMRGTVTGIGRNAFFDGLDEFGCFFELLEIQPETVRMVDKMRETHLNWDGRDPIRDLFDLEIQSATAEPK